MRIETLLNDEIRGEFDELKKLEVGSEKYKTTVDGLTKLIDRAIELNKIEMEYQDKAENRESDVDFKLRQIEEARKERLLQNGITVASIVLPCVITIWGTLKSFEFEKEGTITTIMGRGFINKLLPKK